MDIISGWTVGMAFAGAASGVALNIMEKGGVAALDLISIVTRNGPAFSQPPKTTKMRNSIIGGAFIGAVLGLGINQGIEYFSGDESDLETSIVQKCVDRAPEGEAAVITKDELGNPVCSYR